MELENNGIGATLYVRVPKIATDPTEMQIMIGDEVDRSTVSVEPVYVAGVFFISRHLIDF